MRKKPKEGSFNLFFFTEFQTSRSSCILIFTGLPVQMRPYLSERWPSELTCPELGDTVRINTFHLWQLLQQILFIRIGFWLPRGHGNTEQSCFLSLLICVTVATCCFTCALFPSRGVPVFMLLSDVSLS